ncbi:hypothetical protein TGRH88_023610 [Toxoplasma gondii]|uniref:Uncharacterized protein n=1 Tax=Toxoplasma gondii TaxID=5811 RepID=A0A7J6K935_TOXGO|nr:hypothetical protein TGRH88_023610 [Toxoplasma gondii]
MHRWAEAILVDRFLPLIFVYQALGKDFASSLLRLCERLGFSSHSSLDLLDLEHLGRALSDAHQAQGLS